jgi:hypothetical protein
MIIRVMPNGIAQNLPGLVVGQPAIACGDYSVVGAENCLVAWASTDWGSTLHWARGHVDPSTTNFIFDTTSGMYNGYVVRGGVALAYTGKSTEPWVVAFHQGANVIYFLTKTNFVNANFLYKGAYVVSPYAGPVPALGTSCNSSSGNCYSGVTTRFLRLVGMTVSQ